MVHIQKDEASNLFTMFAAEDSQGQTQTQGAGEQLSQDTAQRNLADAPNTQVGVCVARWGGGGGVGQFLCQVIRFCYHNRPETHDTPTHRLCVTGTGPSPHTSYTSLTSAKI